MASQRNSGGFQETECGSELDLLKYLFKPEEAGLFHQFINYADDDLSCLCNCCRCCCINMSFSNKYFPTGRNVDPSAYIASVQNNKRTGCGQCIIGCPVDAIKLLQRPSDQTPEIPKTWRELIDRQHAALSKMQ